MGILDSLPYLIGGPLILSLSFATYIHVKKEAVGILVSFLLLLWGTVFSLFPFLFFARSYERALLIFHIMTSLLTLIPATYVMGIILLLNERKNDLLWFLILIIASSALLALTFIIPGLIDVKIQDGVYYGVFKLETADLSLISSLFLIIMPSIYISMRMTGAERELRIRARGTIASYVAADIFYMMDVYLSALNHYEYVHLLNGFIVICAYAIYYFSVMRRIYRGSFA